MKFSQWSELAKCPEVGNEGISEQYQVVLMILIPGQFGDGASHC